ncbi:MAG TPA: hypothetical protein VLA15_01810 [Desulfurivibrionaceae bacterium]|nr:hypothetical protein [Desulfurivibrionaceae bacterium]
MGGKVKGCSAGFMRILAAPLVFLAVLSLAGCYEVKEEVIPATLGEIIPYASDRADFVGGGKIIFTRSSLNNDYRFRDISEDGTERDGTFRAMQIKGNIYAVQTRYDEEPHYLILFYAINFDNFQAMEIAGDSDLKVFAARFGVECRDEPAEKSLVGPAEKVLALLRALSGAEFKPLT